MRKILVKREPIIFGIVGLFLGIAVAWSVSFYAVNADHNKMMNKMDMYSNSQPAASHGHDSTACNNLQCQANQANH